MIRAAALGLLAPGLVFLAAAALLLELPGGSAGPALWLGLFYLLGCTALAFAMLGGTRRLGAEVLGLVSGFGLAFWLAGASGVPDSMQRPAVLVLSCSWLVPWCWMLPLRVIGLRGGAMAAFLALAALAVGTPYLVPERAASVPVWIMEWNPLVRLLAGVLEVDWFHGPLFYGRLKGYFRYPAWDHGAVAPLVSAVVMAGVAGVLGLAAKRARQR